LRTDFQRSATKRTRLERIRNTERLIRWGRKGERKTEREREREREKDRRRE